MFGSPKARERHHLANFGAYELLVSRAMVLRPFRNSKLWRLNPSVLPNVDLQLFGISSFDANAFCGVIPLVLDTPELRTMVRNPSFCRPRSPYDSKPNVYILVQALLEVQSGTYIKIIRTGETRKQIIEEEKSLIDELLMFGVGFLNRLKIVRAVSWTFLPV